MMNVDKGEYVHYTLKEIFEQPASIMKTAGRIGQKVAEAAAAIRDARRVYLTGSGSSYNACLVGKYLLVEARRSDRRTDNGERGQVRP